MPGIGTDDVDNGEYVLLDEKGIEGVKLECKKTLELPLFGDSHEIDPIYFDKPYNVVPADDLAEEAFVVLRDVHCGESGLRQ